MFNRHPKIAWLAVVSLAIIILAGAGIFLAARYFKKNPGAALNFFPLSRLLPSSTETQKKSIEALAPLYLGFNGPRTYLLLFENNTEMRPAGGFIGTYGIMKIDQGKVKEFFTDGTENLDHDAPEDFKVTPPLPIQKYLAQKYWYFRDSNWSPDFSVSALNALQFYAAENGRDADQIDAVIAVTPTVLERLLQVTGPLQIDGATYSPDTVVQALEYHVEYGYAQEQIPVAERKMLVRKLGHSLLDKVQNAPPTKWKALLDIIFQSLADRHILVYDTRPQFQTGVDEQGWSGKVHCAEYSDATSGVLTPAAAACVGEDFVMVIDANLAALKTDAAVTRTINYTIRPAGDKFIGRVSVTYNHRGKFDWRTTRYRSYTRFYLPTGTKFLRGDGAMLKDKSNEPGNYDVGEELGKTVVGAFISVEPQTSRTLAVDFEIAPAVMEKIKSGVYTLFVQKQAGTLGHQLTLDLDFGKTRRSEQMNLVTDKLLR
ncbi:MAG: hypothetical protein HW383_760 [Candidatus Magasanikbacteria bacterium]|nr:hypothetical protein [Candidatus Magasanikbacteria bacterium]